MPGKAVAIQHHAAVGRALLGKGGGTGIQIRDLPQFAVHGQMDMAAEKVIAVMERRRIFGAIGVAVGSKKGLTIYG